MYTKRIRQQHHPWHFMHTRFMACQGHTLVELLIALSLSTFILYAIFSLHQAQQSALRQLHTQARQTEAALNALHVMSTHLQLSGFTPMSHIPLSASLFGCTAGRPIGPIDSPHCKSDSVLYSDGLQLTYLADQDSTPTNSQGQPTDCLGQALITPSSNKSVDTLPHPQTGAWSTQRFFVQKSPSTGKPELYCEGSGRPGIAQPIIEGVERLQVRYRLTSSDKIIDAAALSLNTWPKIAAVQLCVVMRDVTHIKTPGASYTDCDGLHRLSEDGILRTALSTWVAIHNRERQ
jgi:type IV pilus assembly protein PilW